MRREAWLGVARGLVAVVGTIPAAWLAAAVLASWWPGPESVRHAIGFVATLPFWVLAMCIALLDARVWRSAIGAGLFAALAYAALAIG